MNTATLLAAIDGTKAVGERLADVYEARFSAAAGIGMGDKDAAEDAEREMRRMARVYMTDSLEAARAALTARMGEDPWA